MNLSNLGNTWRVVCFSSLFLLSLAKIGEAGPVDLSAPANTLGSADLYGRARIWLELGDVNFGNGLSLPFRVEFNSGRNQGSSIFGNGWWCPLLESTAFLKREKALQINLPCGKTLYLRRSKLDKTKFATQDLEWKAVVSDAAIEVSRDDGWLMKFHNGRLVELRTDKGRTLLWKYDGAAGVEIKEVGSPSTDLSMLGESLLINGHKVEVSLGQRPKVSEIQGIRIIEGLEPAVESIRYNQQEYLVEYGVTETKSPTLSLHSQSDDLSITWHPVSRLIEQDSQWHYAISRPASTYDVPRIDRYNARGVWEFVDMDNLTGRYESKTEDSGHLVKHSFTGSGPLHGKLKSIESIRDGVVTVVHRWSYSEEGKLIRETDEKGFSFVYSYDPRGNLTGKTMVRPSSPELQASLRKKEASILDGLSRSLEEKERGDLVQQLSLFYIQETGEIDKAIALIPQISNRVQAFNVEFYAIDGLRAGRGIDKAAKYRALIAKYPEKQKMLEAMAQSALQEAW